MKKVFYALAIASLLGFSFAKVNNDLIQEGKPVPTITIKDMEGNSINTADISNNGKPIILVFWSTGCKPCKLKLNAIHELYPDWQDETGVKLIAVSIDSERTKNLVRPYVNAAGWDYEVWMDANGDFKRALGVIEAPHTFLVSGGEIVFSHSGHISGDEMALYDEILEISE